MWKLVVERVLEFKNQVSGMYPRSIAQWNTGCYISVCCFSLFGLMCRNFLFLCIFFILAWWRKTIQSKQIWGLLCQKAHRKVRVGFEKKHLHSYHREGILSKIDFYFIHSGPENLKKSRQKNSWNQINHKFFFVKLHFWQF